MSYPIWQSRNYARALAGYERITGRGGGDALPELTPEELKAASLRDAADRLESIKFRIQAGEVSAEVGAKILAELADELEQADDKQND